MRTVSIFLGLALSGIAGAQDPAAQNAFSTRLVVRQTGDSGTNFDIIRREHLFRSSTISKSAARKQPDSHGDSTELLARHAEAHLMAGLKKMVSSSLKTHGPKITKFAHGMLQEQLKNFIPAGSKDKGKGKDKGKEKGIGEKGEKDEKKSQKDKGSVKSRDLMGGMQGPIYDNDVKSRKVDYLGNLMTLYEMAERGAAFIDPDRPLWDYD